ncbi:MAG: bifunctional phosphopantothenoylcysteine decarboxylase/phosphopantothenate--cysteine ligase CoaBC [Bacillota bacterium]
MLTGKTVVLGVTGGIAAYKAAEIVSQLVKLNAQVHVLMTQAATRFISPLTLRTLSGNPVSLDLFSEPQVGKVHHIEMAEKADLFLVAPATANFLGKVSHGIADDLLTTTILATQAPVLVAPAMNMHMYDNPLCQENIHRLKGIGYEFIDPAVGVLACGDVGRGKLAPVEQIISRVCTLLEGRQDLAGRSVLITAGGTQEAIDPVRYIGNRSSGKMGYALAKAARARGAKVILVSGPVALEPPAGVETLLVESALEMHRVVMERFPKVDVVIKAAAVADYRPVMAAAEKIKKKGNNLTIELLENPDILKELGEKKREGQILVGFAAETNDLIRNAAEKIKRKKLDMIVANDVTREGAGFGSDTNVVTLLYNDGRIESIPLLPKEEVAHRICDAVGQLLTLAEERISLNHRKEE